MTRHLILGLYLWASALVLGLAIIIAMDMAWRLALAVAVVVLMVMAWRRTEQQGKSARRVRLGEGLEAALQPVQRQPVVLVCGDSQRLFGATDNACASVHFTAQGCYVCVPTITQLPAMVSGMAVRQPGWLGRLSVMLVISPLDHPDHADLTRQIRVASHQLALARKSAAPLPLQLLTYLPGADANDAWFSCEAGGLEPSVRQAGTCTGLGQWQRQALDETERSQRLRACVQLNNALQWLAEAVLPHLPAQEQLVASTVLLVPDLPRVTRANLWHQWLGERTALDGTRHVPADGVDQRLPFPDPLLALLPEPDNDMALRRACVAALWMFTVAASIALVSAFWQNTRLLRQVSDDINLYRAIAPVQRSDQPGFALRQNAFKVLQGHASTLEDHYRNGAPPSLGLGLYRADRLRAPLLSAIADRPPLTEITEQAVDPVRLDSLSLFSVGSAQLKPGSTKVLIQALQHIKAQPGWLIVITGHTDATGRPEHNLQLSRARAGAVRDWMQRMGDIHDSCFAVQGFGASQPIASNDSEVGRSANRRVDIRLVPQAGACASSQPMPDVNPNAA
ncbi:MAG: OmpA family protein [Pseudomonas sp.]|uniref:OmpA family protein n=1 Tax=Pseudomonas sp. TaxID=306 RepID=UPI003D6FCB30